MLPVVAIVGRPNVGKSTLFNCLTQTQNALISNYPGMTRDRQYGEVNQYERHFILIDTGGIIEEKKIISKLVTKQTLQAVAYADQIIFLIDAQTGITPEDTRIAKLLRKSAKPILLVVNKTEKLKDEEVISDAFELGFGTPIAIAAKAKKGIELLLRTLFPKPIRVEKETHDNQIKLAIIGRPNVGKSTLINRMLGEERVIVHDEPGTTRDSIFIPFERFDHHYLLIDTAGVRRRKKVTELPEKFSIVKTLQAIENSNVVLYVLDARLNVSEQDLKLISFVMECGKGLVMAVNKWDDMSSDAKKQTKNSLDKHLGFVHFARLHFISALHGSGVGNLFESVNEAYFCATKKLSTPVLTRLLQKAITLHAPPLIRGHRVKLRYAHPGGSNPPRIIIHGNQLEALPESYTRFLVHYFQKQLKLYGTPLQIIYKTSKNPFG